MFGKTGMPVYFCATLSILIGHEIVCAQSALSGNDNGKEIPFPSMYTTIYQKDLNRLDRTFKTRKNDGALCGVKLLFQKSGRFRVLGFSPDNRLLAVSDRNYGFRGIVFYDAKTGREKMRWKQGSGVFSPDGKLVVGLSKSLARIIVWEFPSGKKIKNFEAPPGVRWPAFSSDGKRIFCAGKRFIADPIGSQPVIWVWDIATGKLTQQITVGRSRLVGYLQTADGRKIITEHTVEVDGPILPIRRNTEFRRFLRLWDIASGRELGPIGPPKNGGGNLYTKQLLLDLGPTCRVRISPKGTVMPFPQFVKDSVFQLSRVHGDLLLINLLSRETVYRFSQSKNGYYDAFCLSPHQRMVGTTVLSGGLKEDFYLFDISSLRNRAIKAIRKPKKHELMTFWNDLDNQQPLLAYRNMRLLAIAGEQATSFLAKRLTAISNEKTSVLIAKLNDRSFATRQGAHDALITLGEEGLHAAKMALKEKQSAETTKRLKDIVAKLAEQPDCHTRHYLWSIELLEHLGTREARSVLVRVATGRPASWITVEAKAALARLQNQP